MDNQKNKQIKQMCEFIVQEAREKANEIKLKTNSDFTLETQQMLHNAKSKLLVEFEQKQKDMETGKKIAKAKAESGYRVKKMNDREAIMQLVKNEANQALSTVTADKKKYAALLKQLIVQGLIKLNEKRVQVIVRECDLSLAQGVYKDAAKEYKELIKKECNQNTPCELELNPNGACLHPPPSDKGTKSCAGGVKLVAYGGRIECDNTLDSRLSIAYDDLMPSIRSTLFTTRV